MQEISCADDIKDIKDNKIVFNCNKSELLSTKIRFDGKNNILFIEDGVKLKNSVINFCGDNSLIYISKSRSYCYLNVSLYNFSTVYIGKNSYFNGSLNLALSEYQNVILGDECLFSFGIWIRTADPHLIYDCESMKRINPSKGVFIGDHVWIGQNAIILKGTMIGSGSIIGAASVCSGKKLMSNCSYGGNPIRLIRKGVFFDRTCVHSWTKDITKKNFQYKSDKWIYNSSVKTMDFSIIDAELKKTESADERLDYLKNAIVNTDDKNRFFIGDCGKKTGKFNKFRKLLKKHTEKSQ